MADFWEAKRQELQQKDPVGFWQSVKTVDESFKQSTQPWWSRGTNLVPQPSSQLPTVPQQPQQTGDTIDGHDVSKAQILKGNAEECPNCPRDPRTGICGNMYRPTPSSAIRCFDCGYVEGRYFGEGQSKIATVEGQSQRAKQTASGGGMGSNFQGRIRREDDPRIVGHIR